MVAANTDGRDEEATIYVIDMRTSAVAPLRFRESRNRFLISRGRNLADDAASLLGETPER